MSQAKERTMSGDLSVLPKEVAVTQLAGGVSNGEYRTPIAEPIHEPRPTPTTSPKPPVLLLGWIPRIVVTVARSLHRHGIPVDVADFSLGPRPVSRAIRSFRRVPRPDRDPTGFVTQIRCFINQGGHDMVIPTDDQTLTALTDHYDDLKGLVQIGCPPPGITNQILDKSLTLRVAAKCEIRVPRTELISNSAQFVSLFKTLPFPWVVKPAKKEVRMEETKAFILNSAEEIAAAFPARLEFDPPMLLQEYCAGVGVGVEMLMHDGECRAVFQHRRLEELPYTGGVSVTAIAEQPDAELVRQSLAILRALKWEGPAMVEFKVDQKSGNAVLMEVNGRYWGTISLPVLAGIDFPLYQWQLAHGEKPTAPNKYMAGKKWRWAAGHLSRLHGLLVASKRSASARRELIHGLAELPRDVFSRHHDALFASDDPMPSIADCFRTMTFLLQYDVKALIKGFSGR